MRRLEKVKKSITAACVISGLIIVAQQANAHSANECKPYKKKQRQSTNINENEKSRLKADHSEYMGSRIHCHAAKEGYDPKAVEETYENGKMYVEITEDMYKEGLGFESSFKVAGEYGEGKISFKELNISVNRAKERIVEISEKYRGNKVYQSLKELYEKGWNKLEDMINEDREITSSEAADKFTEEAMKQKYKDMLDRWREANKAIQKRGAAK